MTAREEVEAMLGVANPAKVGRRYHTASALPPSAWRKSLQGWAFLMLGFVLGAFSAGVLTVLVKVLA
jgi:hypothetical protein